ncbi:response regulator transcription factor [Gynuella sunshinyii]|uniref:Response regulator containing a CheY-like receiver domain and an HTH DNA-binding domain n=1 Tax=Gynuella sunshinyii YC6258 TaxID=1445510 RepID=A0A0C5VQS6_9GAMM|nr:response regulator transcription factor [Gynuella sunshinyii]AJQ92619.1 response regulator containing a CheY-like receiver domain and an HTH DNA-binding domain [Gynuella sunshinyii YC6258]
MRIKVLIAEDHELYRDGLRLLLQQLFADIEVIEAGDFASTKSALTSHRDIALVLLDIHMPGTSGLNGLKEIKACYPVLPVVVVSTVDYQASIQQMLQLGADGFIAKTSSKDTMLRALKDVLAGEQVIIRDRDDHPAIVLSPRQVDILALLAQGLPNKKIANALNISPTTVREHVSDLLKIFDCDNRTQVVLQARQMGFILD